MVTIVKQIAHCSTILLINPIKLDLIIFIKCLEILIPFFKDIFFNNLVLVIYLDVSNIIKLNLNNNCDEDNSYLYIMLIYVVK